MPSFEHSDSDHDSPKEDTVYEPGRKGRAASDPDDVGLSLPVTRQQLSWQQIAAESDQPTKDEDPDEAPEAAEAREKTVPATETEGSASGEDADASDAKQDTAAVAASGDQPGEAQGSRDEEENPAEKEAAKPKPQAIDDSHYEVTSTLLQGVKSSPKPAGGQRRGRLRGRSLAEGAAKPGASAQPGLVEDPKELRETLSGRLVDEEGKLRAPQKKQRPPKPAEPKAESKEAEPEQARKNAEKASRGDGESSGPPRKRSKRRRGGRKRSSAAKKAAQPKSEAAAPAAQKPDKSAPAPEPEAQPGGLLGKVKKFFGGLLGAEEPPPPPTKKAAAKKAAAKKDAPNNGPAAKTVTKKGARKRSRKRSRGGQGGRPQDRGDQPKNS